MAKEIELIETIAREIYPTVYSKTVEELDKKGYPDQDWRIGIALEAFRCAEAFLIAKSVYQEELGNSETEKEE